MTSGEIVVAVLTSSAFTGLLVEIARGFRTAMDKRKNKGLAKIESDLQVVRAKTENNGSKIDALTDELEKQKETDLVLLHDRIWDIFHQLQDAEAVTVEDKANLEYLYDEYKNNNGNHHAEIMYSIIEAKPIKKKGQHHGLQQTQES